MKFFGFRFSVLTGTRGNGTRVPRVSPQSLKSRKRKTVKTVQALTVVAGRLYYRDSESVGILRQNSLPGKSKAEAETK
jgi:hypothetical protein